MYILAINGSPNKNGNTAFLLDEVLKTCKEEGAEVERIDVTELLLKCKTPFCVACSNPCNKSCYAGTPLEEAFEKLIKADAVVFGSPVYFGSMSGQMKAFFDKTRSIRGEKVLIGKPCGMVSVAAQRFGGQEATVRAMQDMALVQGMTIIADGHVSVDAGHHGACSQRPSNEDENAAKRCKALALRLCQEARRK